MSYQDESTLEEANKKQIEEIDERKISITSLDTIQEVTKPNIAGFHFKKSLLYKMELERMKRKGRKRRKRKRSKKKV